MGNVQSCSAFNRPFSTCIPTYCQQHAVHLFGTSISAHSPSHTRKIQLTRSPETTQHVLRRRYPLRLRDRPNRPTHTLVRHLYEPVGNLLDGALGIVVLVDLGGETFECFTGGFDIEGFFFGFAEDSVVG